MTIRNFLLLFLSLTSTSDAFIGVASTASAKIQRLAATYDKEGHHITINPMDGYKGVNVDRARECAETFGKCSIEEITDLRDNLHKERLQNFMVGGTAMTDLSEDALEHRLLEEELELQLELLKDHMPDPSLFPDDEEENKVLPHLKDGPTSSAAKEEHHDVGFFHKPTPTEILTFEETVLEENLVEPMLYCLVLLAFALLPQLLNNL